MNTALIEVVAKTRNLFLDFDGPVCSVFAGYSAPIVAAELRELLGRLHVPVAAPLSEIDDADDPMAVLRYAGHLSDDVVTRAVADALRDAEVTAAKTAAPTPDVDRVIEAATATGRRLAVVSNNSRECVIAYLKQRDLLDHFDGVAARYDGMSPKLMKPDSHLVGICLMGTGSAIEATTLVGDTVSDVQAARSTGIGSIGYANKPGKADALAAAGAAVVVNTMAELADALAATPIRN